MTRYTVVWLDDGVDELAQCWMLSTDRGAITSAAFHIDRRLSTDPQRKATPLSEGLWRFDAFPLRVYFSIREADRQVEISNVVLLPGSQSP